MIRTASPPRRTLRLAAWLVATLTAALLAGLGCSAGQLGTARELARSSEPYSQPGAPGGARLLVVGDSTAVGTGASAPPFSVPGRIGAQFPDVRIDNLAADGATWAGVVAQLRRAASAPRYDVVLLMAGGNDVIRLRDWDDVRADIDAALGLAAGLADDVVVMPAGNVGNAPFFFPPLSTLMTSRSRELHARVSAAAAAHGAAYVNLFHERADDPFLLRDGLYAADGLHPSDAGYAAWWQTLDAQAGFGALLSAAGG